MLEQVNPSQFLGIEINPRAAAIAELVIWIGYLQWYFKRYGNSAPPEPVLQAFGNIENRDAVLAYDGMEPDVDSKTGAVRTRWGGRMMRHPVTGEEVPDPSDRVVIYRYLNARVAEWPEADYIISNPPFVGNRDMRILFGDGYAEILRKIYQDVPDTVDYVMYWWHKAASSIRDKNIKSFGLITTKTIGQVRQRKVIDFHINQKNPIKLFFAIPNHPWPNEGADVRIAMTAVSLRDGLEYRFSRIGKVVVEDLDGTPEEIAESLRIIFDNVGIITSNLRGGVSLDETLSLKANSDLCSDGVKPYGSGFLMSSDDYEKLNAESRNLIRNFKNGRDINQISRNVRIIDCYGINESKLRADYPEIYQILLERVFPERTVQRDNRIKNNWWLFERSRPELRDAIKDLDRYIITVKTSKHRIFMFESCTVLPDQQIVAFGIDDAFYLGLLSANVHVVWAIAAGGRLGIGNDPRYLQSRCFDPFPFPDPMPGQRQKIRELGDRLDSHRKQVQATYPDITITGMYNLLEKLRSGQPFTDADRDYNNKALVSTLKQIHDDLDQAVFEAYGWQDLWTDQQAGKPTEEINETILQRLVALNAERAAEERSGLIRWLRPEYQAPDQAKPTQTTLEGITPEEEVIIEPVEQQKWPTQPKAQLAAIRDLLLTTSGEWTVLQIASQFTGRNTQKKLDAIIENCDRLEWFGVLISREEEGITYWHYAELQQTA